MSSTTAWLGALEDVLTHGDLVSPRGKLTRELPQRTLTVDMRYPVLSTRKRCLSYKFMAAEAYWILTGDDRVSTIAPYNNHIAAFSDDGERFFGAYGPKIIAQLPYVVAKLREDPDSRQAGLTIWRESPPATKDVPCTVAIFFSIRQGYVNAHVFMRSSDIWLGVPYDIFNFSMLGHLVCCLLNEKCATPSLLVAPGQLYLTAASSHLYELNWAGAAACLDDLPLAQHRTPDLLWQNWKSLIEWLCALRTSQPGDAERWWEL